MPVNPFVIRETVADDTPASRADADAPSKPGITPLFVFALALWPCCAAAYELLRVMPAALPYLLALASAVCVALAVLLFVRRVPLVGVLMLGVALGIACAASAAYRLDAASLPEESVAGDWRFTLIEDAAPSAYGSTAYAEAQSACGITVRCTIYFSEFVPLLAGDGFEARATLKGVNARESSYTWSKGIVAEAHLSGEPDLTSPDDATGALRDLRHDAIDLLREHGGDRAGLLEALICGYRADVADTELYADFTATGLVHIIAVSGSHLVVVTALFCGVLRLMRLPKAACVAVSAFFVIAYTVFAGVPISAVRAAAMALVALSSYVARRRSATLNALALVVVGFIAADPAAAVSVSLFLSAASTCGIVLFCPLFISWFGDVSGPVCTLVAEPVAMTSASALLTQPFSAALFSQLPLVAPVANIAAAPLFTLACGVGLACTIIGLACPAAAPVAAGTAALCVAPLACVTQALASVPFCCIAVSIPLGAALGVSALAAGALWIAWPSLRPAHLGTVAALALATCAVAIALIPLAHGDEIVMLDVGQGDAFLVRSEGRSVLIDTGNQDARLLTALGRNAVYRLDGIIVSHADDDHCGALDALGRTVVVNRAFTAADALTCACASCNELRGDLARTVGTPQGIAGLALNDELEIGNFTLRTVWPQSFADEGGNADSLCLEVSYDANDDGQTEWTALFCGDAEAAELEQICTQQNLGSVDVLKVGHHGSRAALTDDLVAALSPRIALLSCGANNRYGHPHAETLAYLEHEGAAILRTDERGDVRLAFTEETIAISAQVPL